ncbi:hypothetical protein [Salinisphaera sp. T31B1]|uniref:hypothetical protein n=1 Tax=Salinisphaera sp. T31B1 TaxID=727963 RepID=UPI0033424514
MKRVATSVALLGTLALVACGNSDHHPKPPPGSVVAPPASPAIHFKVSDGNGNLLDLMIECGADTSIKECAKVNESIIDKVSRIRSQAANGGARPPQPGQKD